MLWMQINNQAMCSYHWTQKFPNLLLPESPIRSCYRSQTVPKEKHPDGSVAPDLVSLAQRKARSEEKKSLDHELSENQWRLLQLMDKNSVMRSATLAQNHFWIIRQDASFHSQTLHDGTQRGEKSIADGMMFVASRPVWSCWHQWQTKEPKGDDSLQIRILGKQRVIQKNNIRCYSASYSWKSLCCSHLVQINIGAKFLRRGGRCWESPWTPEAFCDTSPKMKLWLENHFARSHHGQGWLLGLFYWQVREIAITMAPRCLVACTFGSSVWVNRAYFLGIFECYSKLYKRSNTFWIPSGRL